MKRYEKTVLMNLCMIYDDKENILVQDRVSTFWPGITFPGGHIEKNESVTQSVIREVFEETGLTIHNPILCGIEEWTDEKDQRNIVFFYKTNSYDGELKSSDEGEVFWIQRKNLTDYKLSNDLEKIIRVFEQDAVSELYYFKNGKEWESRML